MHVEMHRCAGRHVRYVALTSERAANAAARCCTSHVSQVQCCATPCGPHSPRPTWLPAPHWASQPPLVCHMVGRPTQLTNAAVTTNDKWSQPDKQVRCYRWAGNRARHFVVKCTRNGPLVAGTVTSPPPHGPEHTVGLLPARCPNCTYYPSMHARSSRTRTSRHFQIEVNASTATASRPPTNGPAWPRRRPPPPWMEPSSQSTG